MDLEEAKKLVLEVQPVPVEKKSTDAVIKHIEAAIRNQEKELNVSVSYFIDDDVFKELKDKKYILEYIYEGAVLKISGW